MAAAGPGFFQMGENTPKVTMQMHAENRSRIVDKLLSMFPDTPKNTFFLLYSGNQTTFHDTDHEPLYRPESNFNYAFGVYEPDFYGAVHIGTKKSILFMPRLSEDYAIWMGRLEKPEYFKAKYEVDEVYYSDVIADVLSAASPDLVMVLHGFNFYGRKYCVPATFQGIEKFKVDQTMLYPALTETRVIKSALEIQLMRELNKISSDAHCAVMQKMRSGYECEWRPSFSTTSMRRAAVACVVYVICATGHNSAVRITARRCAQHSRTFLLLRFILSSFFVFLLSLSLSRALSLRFLCLLNVLCLHTDDSRWRPVSV